MNWITTNIRLPEDLYMDLKMRAARERRSVDAVIMEKLSIKNSKIAKNKNLLKKLETFRERLARNNAGVNLTQAVIDARYEK